jgi:hypothetical protein
MTHRMQVSSAIFGLALLSMPYVLAPAPANAAEKLTAIVQAISAPSLDLRPYDILAAGTRLELKAGESIDIGYFESCEIEHIEGGTIVIDERESWVVDGAVERRKVDCANGGAVMQGAEIDAAVVVVRNAGLGKERVVGSEMPLIMAPGLEGRHMAEIRRLDGAEPPLSVELVDGVHDLARSADRLTPGATYEIRIGERHQRFQVAGKAGADKAEILSRLLLF